MKMSASYYPKITEDLLNSIQRELGGEMLHPEILAKITVSVQFAIFALLHQSGMANPDIFFDALADVCKANYESFLSERKEQMQ